MRDDDAWRDTMTASSSQWTRRLPNAARTRQTRLLAQKLIKDRDHGKHPQTKKRPSRAITSRNNQTVIRKTTFPATITIKKSTFCDARNACTYMERTVQTSGRDGARIAKAAQPDFLIDSPILSPLNGKFVSSNLHVSPPFADIATAFESESQSADIKDDLAVGKITRNPSCFPLLETPT